MNCFQIHFLNLFIFLDMVLLSVITFWIWYSRFHQSKKGEKPDNSFQFILHFISHRQVLSHCESTHCEARPRCYQSKKMHPAPRSKCGRAWRANTWFLDAIASRCQAAKMRWWDENALKVRHVVATCASGDSSNQILYSSLIHISEDEINVL